MDYIRLLINIALSGMFYYFFGQVNIDRFSLAGVSVTKYQEVLSEFPPPGEVTPSNHFILLYNFSDFCGKHDKLRDSGSYKVFW